MSRCGFGIRYMPAQFFKYLSNLKVLGLSNNPQLGYKKMAFRGLGCKLIEKLYLNNTGIAGIFDQIDDTINENVIYPLW